MKIRIVYSFLCVFILIAAISSCGRYIDKATTERKFQVMQGTFTFYPDSNVLVYKSNVALKMDLQVNKPRSFYVKLPKGLKWYEMGNSQSFSFYYDHDQVISIVIDLSDDLSRTDSTYRPSKSDVDRYRIAFTASAKEKYNIWNIEYKEDRKQLLIKKGAATILLYNIVPRNFDHFKAFVGSFKFL